MVDGATPDTTSAANDATDAKPDRSAGGEARISTDASDERTTDLSLPTVDAALGADSSADGGSAAFIHPGLLHTQADFDRMKAKVATNASPWIEGWNVLIANGHASLTWAPNPQAQIHRNDGTNPDNYMTFANDVAAAYACALRWKVSGDNQYADKAVQIMNAWSSMLTKITWSDGHYDGSLVAGIQGYQFANAAEIIRTYAGWAAADFARFQSMMLTVFYPMVSGIFTAPSSLLVYSNWDLCAMAAAVSIAVLCDDREQFDTVINYFKKGLGNGAVAQTVYYVHPGYLGQTQESGRDQGHNTLSISLLSAVCEMAWNQGVDLYGYDNNRVLAAAEYVAKGNLIASGTTYYTVPFANYTNGSMVDTMFSTSARGTIRPEWALVYHHYANRKGLAAPYTLEFMQLTQPEGGGGNYGPNSGGYDQLGYGTLAFTRDPIAAAVAPSGLTAYVNDGRVVLSWWGTSSATSYTVKRASVAGGPYTTIASGISDLLTYADDPTTTGTHYYVVTGATASGETAPSNQARAVTAVQLSTHLTFDSNSGTSAADASGSGHDGTLVGGATWATGKTGNAVSLNGGGCHVSLPEDLMADTGDFAIAAWIYWSASANNMRIFDFGNGTGHYMMLTPQSGAGVIRFAMTSNLGVGEQYLNGTSSLPTGKWVHVAVTLRGTVATLYVSGVAVGTNDAVQLAPFRLGHTDQNWLGRSQYAADPYFVGLIDDFRIYYGALGAADIAALSSLSR